MDEKDSFNIPPGSRLDFKLNVSERKRYTVITAEGTEVSIVLPPGAILSVTPKASVTLVITDDDLDGPVSTQALH